MEEEATGKLDFGALRDAIEGRDPDALLGFYAGDAELRVVDAATPEGLAFELRGKDEIERYLRVVFGQRAANYIGGGTVGEDLITFEEVCEYPDGTKVVVRTTLELREGRISRQLDVVEHSSRRGQQEEVGAESIRPSEHERTIDGAEHARPAPRRMAQRNDG
jgi:hypothetical protein